MGVCAGAGAVLAAGNGPEMLCHALGVAVHVAMDEPEDKWPAIQERMIRAMDRLSKAIPRIKP